MSASARRRRWPSTQEVTLTPSSSQHRLRDAAGGDARGSLTRTRPLEDVADIVRGDLLHPGEVRMAGPGGDNSASVGLARLRRP